MRSNSIFYSRIYLVFYVTMLVSVCLCDSFKTKFRTKAKRKVEGFNYGNKIPENDRVVKNVTEKDSGRGFLPGIFSLGKVLNFFPVGGERECQPTKGYTAARSGICLNPYDCRQRDGRAGGDCAHGLGVCCVFEVTCGGRVQNNLTYFMSPGFPELWRGDRECSVTIDKAHAGIMQLRLDFVHFSIGQPNRTTGECDEDVMTLGDEGNQFKMCGQNHGQHLYYTLSTDAEAREADDDLAGDKQTRLSIRVKGPHMPRLWLLRLAQMPLAHSAPHDCLQYFTEQNGTITTFNYAINGRYLAGHEYRACIRRNTGYCAVRYSPCDERSFRIGAGSGVQTYTADYMSGPGESGGPGTGFYGPDGQFVSGQMPTTAQATAPTSEAPLDDQQVVDSENDPVAEEGMLPAMPADQTQTQEDEVEGSGDDPQMAPAVTTSAPVSNMASRIWSFIWPSWLWGQGSRRSKARTWGFWSPYSQHYLSKEDDQFLYQGYGNFGINFRGFGRQRCQDRITIPCDNEYLISSVPFISGVCDPHHCGPSFCPGMSFGKCHVQSSVSPFAVSMHFGPPSSKGNPEENIGACLNYQQLPCNM